MNEAFAAEDTTTTTGAADQTPYELSPQKMMMDNLFILGMLFFIFYFILIRPQQRKLKAHRELMKALKKGDKVLSTGGIYGTVVGFEGDDIALVEIAPGVKVRNAKSAIGEVLDTKAMAGKSANDN